MKILFVTAKYGNEGAGAGRSVQNFAESVSAAGHETIVVTLSKNGQKTERVDNGVKIITLPLRNIYWPDKTPQNVIKRLFWHLVDSWNILAAKDFGRILDDECPDIVNTNIIAGFSTAIFRQTKKRNIKLVHTLRDYYLLCPQSAMFKNSAPCKMQCASCRPFALARKMASKNVDLFLANSGYVAKRHKHIGDIAVQYNMNEDNKIAAPKTLSNNNTIRFGYIGRICEAKGLEILIEATRYLSIDDYSLSIAGNADNPYGESLKQRIDDKRIEFIGFSSSPEFLENIDILICPSLYAEPLPRVIFEAYRAATPIIAAQSGGIPEIVDHGQTSFLYPPHDAKTLAAHMEAIASDDALYAACSRAAAIKAKEFAQSKITQEYLTHLQALVNEPQSLHDLKPCRI